MEATEDSKGVNIVVSGPLKFVGESDVTVTATTYEERDAMEVLDDEFLASVHSYHVEKGGGE